MTITYGPDVSNYQAQLSRNDARTLRPYGCEFAWIGRQRTNNDTAHRQLGALVSAGVDPRNVNEYLTSLGGVWPDLFDTTRYVAVDVEPGAGYEFTTVPAIDGAIAFIRDNGKEPVIYSAPWAWTMLGLDGVTKYADAGIKVWCASYDYQPTTLALRYPFGGWTVATWKQWTASWNDWQRYKLDMNSADSAVLWRPPANQTALAQLGLIEQHVGQAREALLA